MLKSRGERCDVPPGLSSATFPWDFLGDVPPGLPARRAITGDGRVTLFSRPTIVRSFAGGGPGRLVAGSLLPRGPVLDSLPGGHPIEQPAPSPLGGEPLCRRGDSLESSTGTPVGDVPLGTPHRDVPQGLQREPLTGSGDVFCRKPRGPVGCRAPDLPPERWFWGSAPEPACLRAVGEHHSHTN